MFDEKNDGLIGLIVGFGLGFIAAIILYKSKETAPPPLSGMTEITEEQASSLSGWRPLSTIPSVDRLGEFKPMPVLEIADNNVETAPGTTNYKNSEKIRVLRGPDGRILGYDTDRNAKISK